jgi:TRAP-type C4-dicarboxylate transport system substrate-binding protein
MPASINRTLAVAIIVIASGTGAALAGPPQKNGSVVTLTLAATEGRGRPSTDIAGAFANRVKALSKGTLLVKIAYESGRTQGAETPLGLQESNLVALVRSGKAQLAIVPTRAFDFQGITSFLALQAPFVTTTEAGMDRATTGNVARQLQSGLPKLGLMGLGLVPEGLRRPFGFKHALVKPADFAGIEFIASRSKTLLPLLRLLGATPVNLNGDAMGRAVANGTVAGGDSTLALMANGALPEPGFTAGNLAFFPKVDALVGNASALKRLTAAQRAVLRQAATTARTWAMSHLTEAKGRDEYCKAGGTIVVARASAITALRAKAAPILASLRSDPLTGVLLRELSGDRSGPTTPSCAGSGRIAYAGPTVTTVLPPGVYRKTVSEQQLLAAGASPTDAKTNGGTVTVTVTADGYQSEHLDSPYPEKTGSCPKQRMVIVDPNTLRPARRGLVLMGCVGDFAVAWQRAPGGIEFTGVSAPVPVLLSFWSHVFWKRVR